MHDDRMPRRDLKIAVDGRPLQEQLTGVGKYVFEVIMSIAIYIPECQITIFSNRKLNVTFQQSNIVIKYDPAFEKFKPLLWSKFRLGRLLKREKFDFYFFGGTFTPFQKLDGTKISVVHDLNHIYAKETMSKLHYLTHLFFFKWDITGADVLIANSHATAQKLAFQYKVHVHTVLHPPIGVNYKPIDREKVLAILQKLGINYPYILTVATQEPRKNLDRTINTYLLLKQSNLLRRQKLLLVGGKGWNNKDLQQRIDAEADIIQIGYMPEEYLPYLYNGADSFVFPSKYEGYGMPATEAVLCGLKPVVTDLAELHEATLGEAYFIDPQNTEEYADGIIRSILEKPVVNLNKTFLLQSRFDEEFKNLIKVLKISTPC